MQITNTTSLFFAVVAMAFSATVSADVYKYRDARGHILLTDKPVGGMQLIKRYAFSSGRRAGSGDSLTAMNKRRDTLAPMIQQVADANGLAPALVHAVVRVESAYRSNAVSNKGAVGLMQLMPATAERYGVTDRHDPAQNLRGGTRYLRDLLAMFDNDLQLALAAYNAGENAVVRYGNAIPPYDETRQYVRKVIEHYHADGGDRIALR